MGQYVLTCCSTADMTENYFRERSIPFVCFHLNVDGEQYPDDLGKSMSFDEFYKKISAGS
jgi:fatty acid-binding protein DegV